MKTYIVEGVRVNTRNMRPFKMNFTVRVLDKDDFQTISITNELNHEMYVLPLQNLKEIIERGDTNEETETT